MSGDGAHYNIMASIKYVRIWIIEYDHRWNLGIK